jgi:hypothetical protein
MIDAGGQSIRCHITHVAVGAITGPTLLERLTGTMFTRPLYRADTQIAIPVDGSVCWKNQTC